MSTGAERFSITICSSTGRSDRTPSGPVTSGGGGFPEEEEVDDGADSLEQPASARAERPAAAQRPRIKAMRILLCYPVALPASPKIRLFRRPLRRVPGMSLARAEK